MALVSGYSSEEEDPKSIIENPFGIGKSTINPAKRVKLDGPSLAVVAAPDVLAEVRVSLLITENPGVDASFLESFEFILASCPTNRFANVG